MLSSDFPSYNLHRIIVSGTDDDLNSYLNEVSREAVAHLVDDSPSSADAGNVSKIVSSALFAVCSEKDLRGNTALHLACHLGRKDMVKTLLKRAGGGLTMLKADSNFGPFAESISSGNLDVAVMVYESLQKTLFSTYQSRLPQLNEKLCELDDFDLHIRWKFSSWVPFISRFMPSDDCKLFKRGTKVRLDFSLSGFESKPYPRFLRAPCSVLFSATDGQLVLVNREKRVYQVLVPGLEHEDAERSHRQRKQRLKSKKTNISKSAGTSEVTGSVRSSSSNEGKEKEEADKALKHRNAVKYMMMQGQMTSNDLRSDQVVTKAKRGWFGGLKTEMISGYNCSSFELSGFNVTMKTRSRTDNPKAGERAKESVKSSSRADALLDEEEDEEEEEEEEIVELDEEQALTEEDEETAAALREFEKSMKNPLPDAEIERLYLQDASYFDPNLYFDDSRSWPGGELCYPCEKIQRRQRKIDATIWLSEEFPRRLSELLPIFEILSPSATHFTRLNDFLRNRMPKRKDVVSEAGELSADEAADAPLDLFPIRLHLPIIASVSADAEFADYREGNLEENVDFSIPEGFALKRNRIKDI